MIEIECVLGDALVTVPARAMNYEKIRMFLTTAAARRTALSNPGATARAPS
jgi:hypothetical protein